MTLTGTDEATALRSPAPRLMLVLSGFGLIIPPGRTEPHLSVTYPGLLLLSRLAQPSGADPSRAIADVVAATGADPAELEALASGLEAHGLLVDGAPEPAPTGSPTPAPESALSTLVVVDTPIVFRPTPDGFDTYSHGGEVLVRLTAIELAALAAAARPADLSAVHRAHAADAGAAALDEPALRELFGRLVTVGLALTFEPDSPEEEMSRGLAENVFRRDFIAVHAVKQAIRRHLEDHDRAEAERRARTGVDRVPVIPVTFNGSTPPLALGLIVAYAKVHAGGTLDEVYEFRPEWIVDDDALRRLAETPSIYLFSNYVWSYRQCLAASALVKQLSPGSITIHGGPSTPKYDDDVRAFFDQHPHVDVAVRGEGEATAAAVLEALIGVVGRGDGPPDLSVLAEVEGISYRDGSEVRRTPDRDRIADLDMIPSPWLTGLFDAYGEVPDLSVTIETNRGCPYGCTFCDWGAATMSRIRKFSLDRVLEEIEWLAAHEVRGMGPADANFGIWERDVSIARKVAELKATTGYPKVFGANYAKNTVKHLREIIEIFVDAGILSHGIVSLQSMDAATLDAVHRSNIRLDKYEELATTFRRQKLPLFVDLMVGLPGQTPASFRDDLQQCIDREVQVRIPITELLANSPMNAPEYREEHRIVTDARPGDLTRTPLVISTATFTRAEYDGMRDLRLVFLLAEDFGALRQFSRYVRAETGLREIDLYERMRCEVADDPDRYPYLTSTLQVTPDTMTAPHTWALLVDDLHAYATTELGLPDDGALATVLTVQHHMLPSRDRTFPEVLELAHDYAAWFAAMTEAKDAGRLTDWPDVVPPLRSYGPGTLRIDDPSRMASLAVGAPIESHGFGTSWEHDSAIARPFFAGDRAPGLLTN